MTATNKTKKRRFNWKILFYLLIGILIFLVGIILGMLLGTYTLIDHVAYGLAGSTFIVNFNETNLVKAISNEYIPILNQSIIREFPKCCYPFDCPQSKNNPKNCTCIYAIECYDGKEIVT